MRNVSCKVCSGGPGECNCDRFCGSTSCSWKIILKRTDMMLKSQHGETFAEISRSTEKIAAPKIEKARPEPPKHRVKSQSPHNHMSGEEKCDCPICETYLEMMRNNPAGWLHGVEHVNEGNHPLYRDYSEKPEPKPWPSEAKAEDKKEPVVPKLSEWS